MERELRIEKLKEIQGKDNDGQKDIFYKGERRSLPVYEIPVECLIFNQLNGRIATFVETYQVQSGPIDATTDEGKAQIDKFLWESNKPRNKQTLQDIEKKGQLEPGIVTADGVVIDGNRRFMLQQKLAKKHNAATAYFRAVILPDTLENNRKEIMRLETIYQMGADDKVDYNPIQKYLKCRALKNEGLNEKEIAEDMGETEGKIKNYLSILKLMDEYLEKNGYEGMYRVLEEQKLEGYFERLTQHLSAYENKGNSVMKNLDWELKDRDIDDLREINFDYIRFGGGSGKDESGENIEFSEHDRRIISNPKQEKGFFPNQKIWNGFAEKHFDTIDKMEEEKSLDEFRKDYPADTDILDIINARDGAFKRAVSSSFKENLGITTRKLEDRNNQEEPLKLLKNAFATLEQIDIGVPAFIDQEVRYMAKEIHSMTYEFMKTIDKKLKKQNRNE